MITLYDALLVVREHILEEPARLNMQWWCLTGDKVEVFLNLGTHRQRPRCGTIGCLGGWFEILHNVKVYTDSEGTFFPIDLRDELFFPRELMESRALDGGTPEHARRTVEHLNAFLKKHAARLKAITFDRGPLHRQRS